VLTLSAATRLSVPDHMLTALRVLAGQSAVAVRPACATLWDRIQSNSYASSSSSSSSEFGSNSSSSSTGELPAAGTNHADHQHQPGADTHQALPVQKALVDQVGLPPGGAVGCCRYPTCHDGLGRRAAGGCPLAMIAHFQADESQVMTLRALLV
jgi:hypothetical protein